jgi:hypothetical protein
MKQRLLAGALFSLNFSFIASLMAVTAAISRFHPMLSFTPCRSS